MTATPVLLASAGQADITPERGIQIAGDIGRPRPVEEIRNPLHAKALVVESGGQSKRLDAKTRIERACFISADVAIVMRKWAEVLRERVAEVLDTPPDAVIVHATQSHSAPAVGNHMMSDDFPLVPKELPWLRGGDDRYVEPFMDGVMKAVRQAKESLGPVRMRAVRGMDGRVAFNRRFILRDGTLRTHGPLCSPDVLCCEGPVDPEVGMVVFERESGEPVAALLHHTCHPVHGYPQRYICPDWPGLWPAEVSKLLGGQCVALVANGACGNVHHTNHLDPTYRADVHRFVACLTETAKRILPGLKPVEATPLKWASRTLRIPMRQLPPEEVAAARKLLSDHPEPMWASERKDNIRWDWVYALATLDLARQQEQQSWYDYEIQALRVGGLALIAWPGEPFVEAQLEVKKNSPAAHTFVAHMSNDSAGYQPTREAFQRGGYETRTANWSKLDPCALDMVTAESKAMLGKLFA